ncbi:MAG: radical SAM family heme chaperone HemW [Pikeienuella sp.]
MSAAAPIVTAADWEAGGFGVYIHWPFCLAKCPYCDFNSHVAREIDHDAWAEALTAELRAMRARTGARRVETLFFGGGTPSLMAPATVACLIEEVDRLWGLVSGAEITLEANPTSVEALKFRAYAQAGVNRLSMGVQALNDGDLKALGRTHSAAEARAAFDIARAAFDRVSFDLIYARVGQTAADWEAELTAALALAVDHLSLYQLTVEPGTRFAELHDRGRLPVPGSEQAAVLYQLTQEITEAAGLPSYEISNHARPGAESRHNRIYWRYGDYVGVGPGAHGRITRSCGTRVATETERDPARWRMAVARRGDAVKLEESLSGVDQATEYLLMSMRLTEGADLARVARLAGRPLPESRLRTLQADGVLTRDGDRIVATPGGRLVLNAVLAELLA